MATLGIQNTQFNCPPQHRPTLSSVYNVLQYHTVPRVPVYPPLHREEAIGMLMAVRSPAFVTE